MEQKTIAVLIASHNRCEKTVTCLRSLFLQDVPTNYLVHVYLVDDGSTDGTKQAITSKFPDVHLLDGDGSLYWCGGMRKAWLAALQQDHDFYLLLNDDVNLYDHALGDLILAYESISQRDRPELIVSGTLKDPISDQRSYGGAVGWPNERPIEPDSYFREIDVCAGNLLLVPRCVVHLLGILDSRFTHAMADYDYTLRAKKKGARLFLAKGYQGYCEANIGIAWANPTLSLRQRWKLLHSPKGPPPYQYLIFAFRHKRKRAMFSFIKIYLRVMLPQFWERVYPH